MYHLKPVSLDKIKLCEIALKHHKDSFHFVALQIILLKYKKHQKRKTLPFLFSKANDMKTI